MNINTIIFSYKNGEKSLKIITNKDKDIPEVFHSEYFDSNPHKNVENFIEEEFGVKYDWAFHTKNFTDDNGYKLFYIFYLPEDIKLSDKWIWTDINLLNDDNTKLLEEVRKNV